MSRTRKRLMLGLGLLVLVALLGLFGVVRAKSMQYWLCSYLDWSWGRLVSNSCMVPGVPRAR